MNNIEILMHNSLRFAILASTELMMHTNRKQQDAFRTILVNHDED